MGSTLFYISPGLAGKPAFRRPRLLEVDISYPDDLHNLNNDLPFMFKRRKINGVQKLIPNLYEKKQYVIHIAPLNQVLKHGLVLDKVRQMIEFDQSAWLAPYIEFNIHLRTRAKNNFEKDFFKLMNNSVFGKTMENIKKHKDFSLVTNEEAYLKRVMKPNFKSGIIVSKSLMGCEMGRIQVVMNKPVYLVQAILNLSKIVMYEFHYDYTKLKYGTNLRLCYMDTDSLFYDIKTDDFYEDITGDVKARFDPSSYSHSWVHPLPMGVNKKVAKVVNKKVTMLAYGHKEASAADVFRT